MININITLTTAKHGGMSTWRAKYQGNGIQLFSLAQAAPMDAIKSLCVQIKRTYNSNDFQVILLPEGIDKLRVEAPAQRLIIEEWLKEYNSEMEDA